MSIAQQNEINELRARVEALEGTVDLLCRRIGERDIADDEAHPARQTLRLPKKNAKAN